MMGDPITIEVDDNLKVSSLTNKPCEGDLSNLKIKDDLFDSFTRN